MKTRLSLLSNPILRRLPAIILLLALLASGCRSALPGGPTPPAGETLPTPTAEEIVGLVTVVDDGKPLPPQVLQQEPAAGEELPIGGEIKIVFDQPMDTAATAAAWSVVDPAGKAVAGEVTWPSSQTLQFKPRQPLQTSAVYTASLSKKASSQAGITLPDPLEIQFQTVGELQVSQVLPSAGAVDVANDAVITVIFNRPVVPLVIAEDQAGLPQPLQIDPPLPGKGEWVSTSVYAYRPDGALRGATSYTVTVPAGLPDAAQDTSLAQPFQWQFTTIAPTLASLELWDGTINPQDYFPNARLDKGFVLNFFQPMDRAGTESALSITSSNGENVPYRSEWNDLDNRLAITPTLQLALNTTYNLLLGQDARSRDGGTLREGLNWHFTTVSEPGIASTYPLNGTRQPSFDGSLRIQFKSPMRFDTVKDKIVVTPAIENNPQWFYNDWDFSISLWGLKPSTSYEVRLLPGMEDLYGNAITQATTFRFTTGPYPPSAGLQMPYQPALFRVGGPQDFYITTRNASRVDLQLYQLTVDQFISFISGRSSQWEYTPPSSSLVWQRSDNLGGKLNERLLKNYTLAGQDGQPLAPGFYFLGLDSASVQYSSPFLDTRLLIVGTGNLTFKTASTDALVWLTDLATGQPVSGVPVTFYDRNGSVDASGATDAQGVFSAAVPAPPEPYYPRFALAQGDGVLAFASSEWSSGVNLYDYGIYGAYFSPTNRPTAYIYSDRPIYRPGQPVYFKGILRQDDDLDYKLPDAGQVLVRLESFEGQIGDQTLDLSSFGTFSGEWTLDSEAALGGYTLSVRLPAKPDEVVGSLSFTVAEYRRPEFMVDVTAEPANVLNGQNFSASVAADYYTGGGVAGATARWTLASSPFTFTPPEDLSQYSFTDFDSDVYAYGYQEPPISEIVAEGQEQTGQDGRLSLTLPADLSKYKTARTLTFEATLTDLSGNTVTGRASVVAHLSALYPGIRPTTYIGMAGKPASFDLAAVDWDGVLQPGQKVSVEIVERRWYSVQTQDAEGRIQWSSSVEEIPVTKFDDVVLDGKGLGSVSFIPPKGGVYKAKIMGLDARGNAGRAAAYLWVAGAADEYISWRETNDRGFQLVADKTSYQPGDTAEILIASPFQGEAQALVTVERGHVRFHDVLRLSGNSTIYKLPIDSSMAPNVFVSVVVVKGVDDNNPRPNFKVGVTELKVDTRQQALNIQLTPDRDLVGPGEQVTYTAKVTDFAGNPVRAELSLSLSDLATLSLASPNSMPILDYFYSYRTLGVWTSMPLGMSIEDYNASIEDYLSEGQGMGSGGGKGGGDWGVIEVRSRFPDTAFWEAHLLTDDSGTATVSITLPDNLTTWRMDARAVTDDTRVGQATLDIVSSKPLLVRPQTPRFFVVNDQAQLGAAIHNNTDQPLSVTVSLSAEGLTLTSPAEQVVDIGAKRQAFVSWNVTANPDAARADLVFTARGGEFSDATRPTAGSLDNQGIPIYRFEAWETVGTSGMMATSGSRTEAITLPSSFNVSAGTLDIKVSPSLAAGMTDGLTYLEQYPYECVEQTVSRFLPNVITTRALKSAGLSDPALEGNLATQVNEALQRLYSQQNPDGGWGWWGAQKSDPQTTGYVVLGMVEAKAAGYSVSDDFISRGVSYLNLNTGLVGNLTDPTELNRQSFLVYVLARAGSPDVSTTVKLYDQRQRMHWFARAFLLQTLHSLDSGDPRVQTLLSDLNSAAITSASGTHWQEQQRDPWNWDSDTRTTAIVLSALSSIDPQNPLNANAVRWLMSHRTEGHWGSTQETAWTLMGLTNWMVASGELQASYQYGVAFNGSRLGGGVADSSTLRQSLELKVDVAEMLKDQANRLVFARDEGSGNLYYSAFLNVTLPVEQIQPLDRGIVVSRSYYPDTDDAAGPVTQAKRDDVLRVRLTIVAPHDLHYVVIDDPLPAGLEAINQSLLTSRQAEQPQVYSWNDLTQEGWGWWYFNHVEMRDEKLVLSADYLPAGTYVYTYLVQATTPGSFRTIPPTAQEFYFPDVYGRGEGSLFTVEP